MYKWDYFDEIICISCEESTKRRKDCDIIFKKYNIPIKYWIVKRHPISSDEGVFESQSHIINYCYKNNKKNVLLFEDDIIPSSSLNVKNLSECINFMTHNKWDLFYFGASHDIRYYHTKKITDSIYKTRSICCHALALNRSAIERYYGMEYKDIPIDYIYRDENGLISYAYYPTFFYQHTKYRKYFPQFFVNTYFRLLEFYSVKINIPTNLLYLIITIILLLSLNIYLVLR